MVVPRVVIMAVLPCRIWSRVKLEATLGGALGHEAFGRLGGVGGVKAWEGEAFVGGFYGGQLGVKPLPGMSSNFVKC